MRNPKPNRIFLHIIRDNLDGNTREYTYIILGKVGPTGKTWLCNNLRVHGFNAFEISQDIYNLISYNDDENHYIVDHDNKQVTIILNQSI